jgi:hypothetical protein
MKTSLLCCVIASLLCACGGDGAPSGSVPVVAATQPVPSPPPAPAPPTPPVVKPAPPPPPPTMYDAVVTWDASTENTDGTPLTNLAGYTVRYWQSATIGGVYTVSAGMLTATISLEAGTWHFCVEAFNTEGVYGSCSTTITVILP